ncbi:MAG: phosphatase PAP2 family protein [candidate division Zixibacteria bacterium]|nr:phosphatase PAP2 family protein [candidate division Zixibacteria bacterium]
MSSENFGAKKFAQRYFTFEPIFGWRASQTFLIVLIIVITCICMPIPCLAESDPDEIESLDGLVKYLYRDTKHVMTSPLHWKQDDLVLFATFSVSTFALMLTDTDFQKSVQKSRTHTTDQVSEWTDKYTKRVTNLTIGGLYFSGLIFHDRKAKETALLCLESVALAEGITKGLKHLIGRSRPTGEKGAFHFNPLRVPPAAHSLSFPSGHATTAFALSSVIGEQYQNWWVRLIAYSFALMVSMARVNNNAHFLSDVFWGGIVGISVGRCLVKFHEKDNTSDWELISTNGSDNVKLGISIWVK